ncbi:HpcH/HpaI aldolase/citrate lyase family protein [Streptantibioticus ferralitis]|uniref:CoA ester lyase n=1 Tax=Streptantibioticus ferralitis TaxID=236510 RepID=A0ABT5Z175_9ACTN|nr:CoA ester lyase [Streptantibioticus ferralitis]MDF2257549.1 CoA ester lyase [Streptantibioticus ferralitis]
MLDPQPLSAARTFLFVPADRPECFAKAARSGADAVVLDLEDTVAPEAKGVARANVSAWLHEGHDAVVRVNAVGSPWYEDDLNALVGAPQAVMLPKAQEACEVSGTLDRLAAASLVIPLVETAAGVIAARTLCAVPGVVRLAFGHLDLAAELGVDPTSRQALLHARSALVLAAAAASRAAPVDGVTTDVRDPAAVADDARHCLELGFTGKLCIHPGQVAIVHQVMAPSEAELAWAHQIMAVASTGGVTSHAGQMIDRPVMLRAQALIDRAGRP